MYLPSESHIRKGGAIANRVHIYGSIIANNKLPGAFLRAGVVAASPSRSLIAR